MRHSFKDLLFTISCLCSYLPACFETTNQILVNKNIKSGEVTQNETLDWILIILQITENTAPKIKIKLKSTVI